MPSVILNADTLISSKFAVCHSETLGMCSLSTRIPLPVRSTKLIVFILFCFVYVCMCACVCVCVCVCVVQEFECGYANP